MKPIDFFTPDRLDLIIKYLQAKNYLSSIYNKDVEDLYIRHIIMRTGGIEPEDCLTHKTDKTSVIDYLNSFKNLILDMKQNGFNPKYPIPVDKNKKMLNGAHRIATALALNIKEIPTEEVQESSFYPWDFNWFQENGFSVEDKQRILKGYVDLHLENCSLFVIWQPALRYYGHIQKLIQDHLDIVGSFDLDFEDNYIAFYNILLEIYEFNIRQLNGDDTTIFEKAKLLSADYLNFRIVVASNQYKNSNEDISKLAKQAKQDIRDFLDHRLPKKVFCTSHSSDGQKETQYLANILLSPNNIKHLKMRQAIMRHGEFIQNIRKLSNFLPNIDIHNTDEICVVRSGSMSALGILENSDLDFVIASKHRKKFGNGAISLSSVPYDIEEYNKIGYQNILIDDDVLISDDNYHFYFKGLKFANLEIIKNKKLLLLKKKDAQHLRLIELWENMFGHIEQQRILFQRIQNEIKRREEKKSFKKPTFKYRLHIGKFDIFSKRKKDNKTIYRILGIKFTQKKPVKK